MGIVKEVQKVKDATTEFAVNVNVAIAAAKARKVFRQDIVAILSAALFDMTKDTARHAEFEK